ncbi:MAG TPA: hypothetical protein VEX39_18685 [Thermoleophilaceae bacterium]|nr:hypothetical protein [Thermoleophilaceae bacterium]
MVSDSHEDCPACGQPTFGAGGCCCGWHLDGGTVPVAELAEAAPL